MPELPDVFRDDVAVCFESLLETCEAEQVERALVVSHGGVIGTILERFAEPGKHWYEYNIPCGGFAVLSIFKYSLYIAALKSALAGKEF